MLHVMSFHEKEWIYLFSLEVEGCDHSFAFTRNSLDYMLDLLKIELSDPFFADKNFPDLKNVVNESAVCLYDDVSEITSRNAKLKSLKKFKQLVPFSTHLRLLSIDLLTTRSVNYDGRFI